MKTVTADAIILKRMNFGEADRILTLLTPEHGKISVIAKGVRRQKSRLSGGLELFSVTSISYIDGRSELKTVVSTRLISYYENIVKDINATMLAYDFLKRIDEITEDATESPFFGLLHNSLAALNDQLEQVDLLRAWFYAALLQLGGHGLNLDTQVSGAPFSEDELYRFDFETMAFFAHDSGTFSPKHIKLLRLFTKTSTPANLLHVGDATALATSLHPLLDQCLKLSR